jgi:thiol-disulfide isomerase/thioredoxin
MKRAFAILVCGAMAAIWYGGVTADAQQALRRAPGWALVDSTGKMHDLMDYRGKVLVLEMMQSTCPHCAAFADILAQVPQKYGDQVAIVAVASIPQDNAETVKQYVAGHKVTYPIVFDAGQMQYSYILKGRVDLPYVYIIDQSGNIRGDYGYGVTTRDVFEGKRLFTELDRLVGAPGKK